MMLTRTEELVALTRGFAGPYPGPNRLAIARVLAEAFVARFPLFPPLGGNPVPDTDDPFDTPEFRDYARRVRTELIPKLRDSAASISLVPNGPTDVKFAVELGLSIMLDKPIVAVVPPGTKVPAKLVAVADRIVEGDLNDRTLADRLNTAIREVLG
ncbi:hypothetical protein BST13_33595 [Mycobacterium aquaticum]|uniref:Uncharacterized protein n=1 Tax=Mycobacterium aquaticum TaxID=1927124 RepID=A0A1X0A5D9_9MYCO|nr:hypothetical protein BST13_33595 [Mycobacterium aquaticum]